MELNKIQLQAQIEVAELAGVKQAHLAAWLADGSSSSADFEAEWPKIKAEYLARETPAQAERRRAELMEIIISSL